VGNNSVSLSTTLDKSFDIYAISEAGGSGSSSPILPIVVVLVVLMLIGVGVMRNRASAAKVAHVELTDQAGQVNEPQPGE
ncbi:MAG: hypothetical protein ACYC0U_08975, partial [Ilumatobacteraceae bacterium]